MKEKSFQDFESFDLQNGDFRLKSYRSDSLTLKGLLNIKNIDHRNRKPVVIYLHGGFALNFQELEQTQPFTDAGFIVYAPTYRGENGNPGFFELFMGEVRDVKAAIEWISKQPFTDSNNIFVFGWSIGGGIALQLSLHDDVPIKLSGSSAGIYEYDVIEAWATMDEMIRFPYNHRNEMENFYRLPVYTLEHMTRPHYAYIGEDDGFDHIRSTIDSLYPEKDLMLNLIKLKGDHVSSLTASIQNFLEITRKH